MMALVLEGLVACYHQNQIVQQGTKRQATEVGRLVDINALVLDSKRLE